MCLESFCAMHFQAASQMHHCINCDTLSDLSEEGPEPE